MNEEVKRGINESANQRPAKLESTKQEREILR
jgi:hypothetical protein